VSVTEVLAWQDEVRRLIAEAMRENVHYGLLPKTERPVLLKPGAELLAHWAGLHPSFPKERQEMRWTEDGHLVAVATCVLTDDEGRTRGEGSGLCSSAETGRSRPGKPAADAWNAALKQAQIRAFKQAVLMATHTSAFFTQDVLEEPAAEQAEKPAPAPAPRERAPIRSWKEVQAVAEALNVRAEFLWFVQDACELLYSTRESGKLTKEERDGLLKLACGALEKLRDREGDFPPPSRQEIREAWAGVLDGIELPGPPWRMSPDETDRPVVGGGDMT